MLQMDGWQARKMLIINLLKNIIKINTTMVKLIENLKMEIQLAVMILLPTTASKFLLMIGMLPNKDGKYFYNQDSPKLFHMSKDDCDIALQTLIDNGFVNVTNIGNETFEISINYDRFEDFDFTLDELIDKEDIKLSTKVTFRKSNVDRILDELNDSEKDELLYLLYMDKCLSGNEYYEKMARAFEEAWLNMQV